MNNPKRKGGKPILCLDFDGVLHWYRSGWLSATTIDDEPVPGAVDFVIRAQQLFSVVIYSSRSSHPGGIEAMREWMRKYGFPEVTFATQKPAAFLTIDDRALTFNGSWPDPEALRAFQPWTRQTQPEPGTTLPTEETSMLKELVQKSRSVRRFYQDVPIEMDTLRELVNLARLSPSGANLQSLKYYLSNQPEKNARIFQHLAWAGYLKEWPGPEEGERPAGYIIVLGDSTISKSFGCDHGIAAQSIMLGAAEQGLGGCLIGSVKRADLSAELNIPPQFEILLVLALGKPKETVVVDPLGEDGSVKYWRDEQQVHHVPKRALEDLILE
jgi:nitroreductase